MISHMLPCASDPTLRRYPFLCEALNTNENFKRDVYVVLTYNVGQIAPIKHHDDVKKMSDKEDIRYNRYPLYAPALWDNSNVDTPRVNVVSLGAIRDLDRLIDQDDKSDANALRIMMAPESETNPNMVNEILLP